MTRLAHNLYDNTSKQYMPFQERRLYNHWNKIKSFLEYRKKAIEKMQWAEYHKMRKYVEREVLYDIV